MFPKSARWGIPRSIMGFSDTEAELHTLDTKAVAAEFLGTFTLVLIGCGTACSNGWFDAQTRLLVAFAYGMTLMALTYAIGHQSGGQFNVAVTFSLVIAGHVPFVQGLVYAIVQLFASLIACGVLCIVFPCSADITRNIASNIINKDYADPGRCIVAEAFGTLLLCTAVFETAVSTKSNCDGCSISPMRSTGASIVSKLRGCDNFLEGGLHDLWVMWVGPMIGAVFAGVPRHPGWMELAKRYKLSE